MASLFRNLCLLRRPCPSTHGSTIYKSILQRSFATESSETTSLAKTLASALAISRRNAETFIQEGKVKVNDEVQTFKGTMVNLKDLESIRMNGKPLPTVPSEQILVWAVHKLPGEEVAEHAESSIPSMMDRLRRGGVGKVHGKKQHLKAIGRLDVPTEGLILVTNNGDFAREMEHPRNKIHRTYRVRAHGFVMDWKLERIAKGITIEGTRYSPMRVRPEKKRRVESTNQWFEVTCHEGKNRQVRKVFSALGLKVTRLIRTRFGDYSLETIPPGMALPVPYKAIERQKRKGDLFPKKNTKTDKSTRIITKTQGTSTPPQEESHSPVEWVRTF